MACNAPGCREAGRALPDMCTSAAVDEGMCEGDACRRASGGTRKLELAFRVRWWKLNTW